MGFHRALASGALAGAFCAARAVALRAGGEQQFMQRGNIFETPVLLLLFVLLALYFPHAVLGAPMGALRALHRAASSSSRETAAPRRRVLFVLKGLLALCVLGFAMQERYYRVGHCATSRFYNEQNGLIFKTTADVLTRAGAAWYLDRASLLACLRHQDLLPWDADSDVGVLLPPGEEQPTIDRLKAALEGTRLPGARGAGGMVTNWDARRDLLQVYPDSGVTFNQAPHVDLWFHRRSIVDGEVFWTHRDDDTHYMRRAERAILPLGYRTWMGANCSVPSGAHDLSRLEFGASYMTPAIYRAECVHNSVNGRSWY